MSMDVSLSPQSLDRRRLVMLGCSLVVLLAACKACVLPWTGASIASVLRWSARLAVVSAADVSFAAALTAVGWLLVACGRRTGRFSSGAAWTLATTAFATSALYGVASVPVFLKMNVQLTYPLLSFMGGWREMSVSVRSAMTWHAWTALAVLPLLSIAAYRAGMGWLAGRAWRANPLAMAAMACLLVCYLVGAEWWAQAHWRGRHNWQGRAARSPHWQLIASAWRAVKGRPFDVVAREAATEGRNSAEFLPRPVSPSPAKAGRPKSAIMLVLESVGADYMQIYGSQHATTPEMCSLADHALVFDHGYAQSPSSAKALVSIVTGAYPRLDAREQTQDGSTLPSLARTLREQGRRTALIHSGNWSWRGGDDFVRRHGFDYFRDARELPISGESWGAPDAWLFAEAWRWIRESDQPFFLLAWTIQTHHPYRCLEEIGDFGVDDAELNRYLNAIRETDALIGQFWRQLVEHGLADDVVLVVVGDHGEAFGQHDQRLHIFGLYEENVHVPLLFIHNRPELPTGRRQTIAQQVDLAPTLCDMLGVGAGEWQGCSLLDPTHPNRAFFYTVWDPVLLGVRTPEHKYVWEPGGEDWLFDLRTDAGEQRNLARQLPDKARDLRSRTAALAMFQHAWLAEREADPRR